MLQTEGISFCGCNTCTVFHALGHLFLRLFFLAFSPLNLHVLESNDVLVEAEIG